jgi:hypothetical protein
MQVKYLTEDLKNFTLSDQPMDRGEQLMIQVAPHRKLLLSWQDEVPFAISMKHRLREQGYVPRACMDGGV